MNVTFSKSLQRQILHDLIGTVRFTGEGVWLPSYHNYERASELLTCLLKTEFVAEFSLLHFVHTQLIEQARLMLSTHKLHGIAPDHLFSPRVFGFGIAYGFTKQEIESIIFDHGETVEEYLRKAEGLLPLVVEKLLHPSTPVTLNCRQSEYCEGC